MANPDGTVDDWHETWILNGKAVADHALAFPLVVAGVVLDPIGLAYIAWTIANMAIIIGG